MKFEMTQPSFPGEPGFSVQTVKRFPGRQRDVTAGLLPDSALMEIDCPSSPDEVADYQCQTNSRYLYYGAALLEQILRLPAPPRFITSESHGCGPHSSFLEVPLEKHDDPPDQTSCYLSGNPECSAKGKSPTNERPGLMDSNTLLYFLVIGRPA